MLSFILLDLTLRAVLADVPHDAGAIVVCTLPALFVAFTWAGGQNRPDLHDTGREDHDH